MSPQNHDPSSRLSAPGEEGPPGTEGWVLRWDTREGARPKPPALPPWTTGSVAETADGGWAAIDGQLFDRSVLASDVGLEQGASDASLAAAAVARWGTDAAKRFRGAYLIAVWRPASQTLLVVRDPMGIRPAYYHWDEQTLLLSSSLGPLFAQPEVTKRVRRESVAELFMLSFADRSIHETLFLDIDRIPAAHCLHVKAGQASTNRYWDPLPAGFEWATKDEVASFPDVFETAVRRTLDAGADSIALSGGFDSVGIAAVAARRVTGRPPLHAASLRFPGESVDEAATQVRVAEVLGMPQTMVTLDEGLEGSNLVEAALDIRYDSPTPVLSLWNSLYSMLFRRAHDAGCRRMLFGTGGDEMLCVDFAHANDSARHLRLGDLWRYVRALQRTSPFHPIYVARLVLWQSAVRPALRGGTMRILGGIAPGFLRSARARRAQRRVPDWIAQGHPSLVESLTERSGAPRAPGDGPDAEYIHRMRRLVQSPVFHMELDQSAAWGRHMGLVPYYPFLDSDVVGLALRTHPRDLIANGRFKSPLRDLVGELLPDVAMPSRKVDFTALMRSILRRHGPAAWKRLGGAPCLVELGVVSASHLEKMMQDFFAGKGKDTLRPWLVLSAETWMRRLT